MDYTSLFHEYYEPTSPQGNDIVRLKSSWQSYLQNTTTETALTTYVVGERGNGKTKLLVRTLHSIREKLEPSQIAVFLSSDTNNDFRKQAKALYYALDPASLTSEVLMTLPDITTYDFTNSKQIDVNPKKYLDCMMRGQEPDSHLFVRKDIAVAYFFNELLPALIKYGKVSKFALVVDDRDVYLTDKSILNSPYLALVRHIQELKGAWALFGMRTRTLAKVNNLARRTKPSQRINLNKFTEAQAARVMFNMCGKGINELPIQPTELKSNLHLMLLMNQLKIERKRK